MKRKTFALVAILLTTLFASEAKAVSRAVYCDTLVRIIISLDEEQDAYEMSRDYGVYDAWHEHCR